MSVKFAIYQLLFIASTSNHILLANPRTGAIKFSKNVKLQAQF